ncbi:hypothetical protein U1Q18_018460 [Sarracenia purpurea var. burkii]
MNTPMKIARVPTMRRETASAISLIGGPLFQVPPNTGCRALCGTKSVAAHEIGFWSEYLWSGDPDQLSINLFLDRRVLCTRHPGVIAKGTYPHRKVGSRRSPTHFRSSSAIRPISRTEACRCPPFRLQHLRRPSFGMTARLVRGTLRSSKKRSRGVWPTGLGSSVEILFVGRILPDLNQICRYEYGFGLLDLLLVREGVGEDGTDQSPMLVAGWTGIVESGSDDLWNKILGCLWFCEKETVIGGGREVGGEGERWCRLFLHRSTLSTPFFPPHR